MKSKSAISNRKYICFKTRTCFKKLMKEEQGFTLVEVLTVLVIITILAAVAIPTMSGFINDTKKKSYITQAREVYVAAQAAATGISLEELSFNTSVSYSSGDGSSYVSQIEALLGSDIKDSSFTVVLEGPEVDMVTYTPAGGDTITISGGESVTYEDGKKAAGK